MTARVAQLAYVGFAVKDLAAWQRFGADVLGLMPVEPAAPGTLAFRLDERAQRIVCEPGPSDDLAFLGWEVESAAALDALSARLEDAGVAVREGSAEEAARRKVARLCALADPSGIPLELVVGGERAAAPFRSAQVLSHFVAGDRGLGHVVLAARDPAESLRFYTELLGFRLSDRITTQVYGYDVDIAFLHANPRHHSLALGGPQRKRLHHLMLEVGSLDDVGLAMDRTLRAGLKIMQTLGRHPNDRMFSFYAKTPSGFQFEYGWGGREIDDATWAPTTYSRISEWGHHPPALLTGELELPK
jgi:2,3-dihydroxybiphenyl 1,2-dioxygenase